MKIKHVIIDAGHGGLINGIYQTSGKRSPVWSDGSQYFEGVGNRMIRNELSKLLKKENIPFNHIGSSNFDTPLIDRVRKNNNIAREKGINNTLTISIHSNGFTRESAHGWECYTSPKQTLADLPAEILYKKMKFQFQNETFRTDLSDGDIDKEAHFYILRKTINPAILSENFFHTNERECREILMKKSGRKKIAMAHFEMIKEFL